MINYGKKIQYPKPTKLIWQVCMKSSQNINVNVQKAYSFVSLSKLMTFTINHSSFSASSEETLAATWNRNYIPIEMVIKLNSNDAAWTNRVAKKANSSLIASSTLLKAKDKPCKNNFCWCKISIEQEQLRKRSIDHKEEGEGE